MKVLTANRLIDGEAVWYAEGAWIETIAGATVVSDKDGEARLQVIGKAAFDANQVVDVELIDVDIEDGGGAYAGFAAVDHIRDGAGQLFGTFGYVRIVGDVGAVHGLSVVGPTHLRITDLGAPAGP